MSVAFGKAPSSLAVLPGLAAAVAHPRLRSERAAPPRGSPERGFWLWQWVLRAGAVWGAAAWPYARVSPPDKLPESQFAPSREVWAGLCSGLRSCPTGDSAHLSVPRLLLFFPPPFQKEPLFPLCRGTGGITPWAAQLHAWCLQS